MRGYAVNPTQYYCTNSAGAITIGVGLQNVSTVNCIYGCVTNGVTQNLGNLGHPEILCSFVIFFLKYNNKIKLCLNENFLVDIFHWH